MRRAHNRDAKRDRNSSPEYDCNTSTSPVDKYSVTTLAANADRRMHGSKPPAVSGETAPAASPINRPDELAIFLSTPPTGMRPARASICLAFRKSIMPATRERKSSNAVVGSNNDG